MNGVTALILLCVVSVTLATTVMAFAMFKIAAAFGLMMRRDCKPKRRRDEEDD